MCYGKFPERFSSENIWSPIRPDYSLAAHRMNLDRNDEQLIIRNKNFNTSVYVY